MESNNSLNLNYIDFGIFPEYSHLVNTKSSSNFKNCKHAFPKVLISLP